MERLARKIQAVFGKNSFPLELSSCLREPHWPALYLMCWLCRPQYYIKYQSWRSKPRFHHAAENTPAHPFDQDPGSLSPAVVVLEVEQVTSRWRSSSEPWLRLATPPPAKKQQPTERPCLVQVKIKVFRYLQFWRLRRQSLAGVRRELYLTIPRAFNLETIVLDILRPDLIRSLKKDALYLSVLRISAKMFGEGKSGNEIGDLIESEHESVILE